MTYDLSHLRQTTKPVKLLLLDSPGLLSITRTKRSEIIVNAQEIAASLVASAACCINWSCCIQGANSLSKQPVHQTVPNPR